MIVNIVTKNYTPHSIPLRIDMQARSSVSTNAVQTYGKMLALLSVETEDLVCMNVTTLETKKL